MWFVCGLFAVGRFDCLWLCLFGCRFELVAWCVDLGLVLVCVLVFAIWWFSWWFWVWLLVFWVTSIAFLMFDFSVCLVIGWWIDFDGCCDLVLSGWFCCFCDWAVCLICGFCLTRFG